VNQRELLVAADPDHVAKWCHERLGAGVLYVAPSAASRQAARRAVLGGNGVAVGARIVNLSGLLGAVEAKASLAPLPEIGSVLSRLLLVESGRAARVPLFGDATPPGAVSALGRLFGDLRLNDVSPDTYRTAGGDARAADAYARYEAQRQRLGLADAADRLRRAAEAMPELPTVVLEDPAVASALHARLFAALVGRAASVSVGISGLSEVAPPAPCGPAATSRAFFRGLQLPERSDDALAARPEILALSGVGSDGEVALVARHILALLRAGTPADRILGVAPQAAYLERLHEASARIGVPVASPRRLAVLDVPLVRTLLAVVEAIADAEVDTAERGLGFLGMPYLGLSLGRHDEVHRRLTLAGQGSLRSWKEHARLPAKHPSSGLATALEAMTATLATPQVPSALATIASRLVLDFGFLSSARRHYLSAGRDDAVRADQQAWEVVQEAFDEVDAAFQVVGRARVGVGEWLAELTGALQAESVRLDHRGVQGVRLTVAGAGLPAADHVYAVGWREGVFPRRPREDPLLPDEVKARLNAGGARLALAADRAAQDEERRDRIVRAARLRLTVSWPQVAVDGTPQLRSFFAQDIGVPEAAPAAVGETTWPLDLAADRPERLARTAVLLRHRAEAGIGGERPALDALLRGLGDDEARALRGGRHAPRRIVVPADLVESVRRRAAHQSASQANTLARCLYAHFGEKRLEVAALAAPEMGVMERGGIAHRVLADLARGGDFAPERAGALFDRWWPAAVPPHLAHDSETAFEGGVLRAQVVHLAEVERDLLAQVTARPDLLEFGFGMPPRDEEYRDPRSLAEGVVYPLPASAPIRSVTLRGAIDRVDVVEVDGKRYGVAIDYKGGNAESYGKKLEALADFQLPIYCEVLRHAGVEPVGAVFLGVASAERYGLIRADLAEHFLNAGHKGVRRLPREAFDHRLELAMGAFAALAAQAAVPEVFVEARDDDCQWCELASLCRIGTFGVGGSARGDD
jgi:hypothetical protein